MKMPATPQCGDFVRVRTRRWLVEGEGSAGDGLATLRLACVSLATLIDVRPTRGSFERLSHRKNRW
jgi:hypothetical protein